MTPREALRWECQRHLDQRLVTRRESAPAAWLVILMGLVGLILLSWVVYRLVDQWVRW